MARSQRMMSGNEGVSRLLGDGQRGSNSSIVVEIIRLEHAPLDTVLHPSFQIRVVNARLNPIISTHERNRGLRNINC